MIQTLFSNAINVGLFVLCVALGVYTFDTPLLFDVVSVLTFACLALVFRKDIDILSLCIILICNKLVIDGYALASDNDYFWKFLSYGFTAAAFWYTRHDKVTKICTALLALTLAIELYWYVEGYQGPEVYFYFYKIAVFVVVRYALIYRPHGLFSYFDTQGKILRADWIIYKTKGLACFVECFMIIEYLIRHTLPVKPILLYEFYPPLMQCLGVWVMWIVFMAAKNNFEKSSVTA